MIEQAKDGEDSDGRTSRVSPTMSAKRDLKYDSQRQLLRDIANLTPGAVAGNEWQFLGYEEALDCLLEFGRRARRLQEQAGARQLLLRPTEAADQLGVSRSTIYEEIRSGRIESVLIGASRRVPWDALVAYIDRIRKGR